MSVSRWSSESMAGFRLLLVWVRDSNVPDNLAALPWFINSWLFA